MQPHPTVEVKKMRRKQTCCWLLPTKTCAKFIAIFLHIMGFFGISCCIIKYSGFVVVIYNQLGDPAELQNHLILLELWIAATLILTLCFFLAYLNMNAAGCLHSGVVKNDTRKIGNFFIYGICMIVSCTGLTFLLTMLKLMTWSYWAHVTWMEYLRIGLVLTTLFFMIAVYIAKKAKMQVKALKVLNVEPQPHLLANKDTGNAKFQV